MKTKVLIKDLQWGMYVYELDRPWTDTPFTFQGFVLRSQDQLETLRKFCQHVFVDTERANEDQRPSGALSSTPMAGTKRVEHLERVDVGAELPRARAVATSAEAVISDALKALNAGDALDAGAVKGAVNNMTESIMRNPDALVLFSALRERGGYFLTRAMNSSVYLIVFTRFLGMEPHDIERAGMVGLLPDIAMLQLPAPLLEKREPLTPTEVGQIRTHVQSGIELLKKSGIPEDVTDLVAQHHERHDGSGYPRGLRGSSIATVAACAGIVDTFGAMTVKRPYAEAVTPSNVLGIMHKWKDRAFNAWLVEEFIRCIGVFPVGSVVEMNTGEIGIVISQNVHKRLQPRVMVVKNDKGERLHPHKLLDLSRLPKATNDEPYRIRRTLEYGRAGVGLQDL